MPRLAAFNFGARKFGFGSLFSSAAATEATYIEDVFSTYLYTGNGSSQTITNGINLSTYGGLVWTKTRSSIYDHILIDSARYSAPFWPYLITNTTSAQANSAGWAFNSNGYNTLGGFADFNNVQYVSWTFREQPKFFDIVTYTGNGANRTISHNLGSVPGCIIVKRTDSGGTLWAVYHRSLGATQDIALNSTDAAGSSTLWNSTAPTSTQFTVGTLPAVNANGGTYVAYLFAHNAGGFGLTGSDNVISCGSFTGAATTTVNLGWEPQWILWKRSDGAGNWEVFDTMRGWSEAGGFARLWANTSDAESTYMTGPPGAPTATGFTFNGFLTSGATYIYIAIRRGPMKVPTSGTSVFSPAVYTGNGVSQTITTNFVVDAVLNERRNSPEGRLHDRMRGDKGLLTVYTNAEATNFSVNLTNSAGLTWAAGKSANNAYYLEGNDVNVSAVDYVSYAFRRAPSYFDVVCFRTQSSGATTVTHGLGVAPEFMIVKSRDTASAWYVYSAAIGNVGAGFLNSSGNFQYANGYWDYLSSPAPTATQFTCGTSHPANSNTVAYLFATCAGVSKVGSYTGTGTTQQINCGFTGGARFVLIKRTDSTGDWYTWDTARGIIAGNDPYLLLDSTAAEVTNTDYIDPVASGFEISSTAPAAINANGGTYIFLAIA